MAKLTQAEVKAKADEYAGLQQKIQKAEDAKARELAPFEAEFEEKTAAIVEKHDAKIVKLANQAAAIEDEVLGWLNGVGKPIALEGELAVASVQLKTSSRKIDPETFFKYVKDKSAAFWDCVSIGIAKAEKLVGNDKIDQISSTESKLVASLKLK